LYIVPILRRDPRVRAVPLPETGERLVMLPVPLRPALAGLAVLSVLLLRGHAFTYPVGGPVIAMLARSTVVNGSPAVWS
jgi:hypothetical protein